MASFNCFENSLRIFTSIYDKITGIFGGIKDKVANSWLGKKLGFGNSETVKTENSNNYKNTATNTTNTTNVKNNNGTDKDALKSMTRNITAPLNQLTRLVENQGKLMKSMNDNPAIRDATFVSSATPVKDNIIIRPNDNIASTLIQQTSTVSSTQVNNNREIAEAFNAGVDKLVGTLNSNFEGLMETRQGSVQVPG